MALTRFEKKIVGILIIVGVGSVSGALFIGKKAFESALGVGINPRIRMALEQSIDTERVMIQERRARAMSALADITQHKALIDAAMKHDQSALRQMLEGHLDRDPALVGLSLNSKNDPTLVALTVVKPGISKSQTRTVQLDALWTRIGPVRAEATVQLPATSQHKVGEIGIIVDTYARLETRARVISSYYLIAYGICIGALMLLLVSLGLVLTRRVTKRVAELSHAVKRVGEGDMQVALAPHGNDEVSDLTRAFNQMVVGLRDSRERIAYLDRLSGWQEFARRLAHEIKNPLTPIQLASQELRQAFQNRSPEFCTVLEEACSVIEEEVETLRHLVGEFSDFARLPRVHLHDAELGDFLSEVARSAKGICQEMPAEDIVFVYEEPPRPIHVRIDPIMLKRALHNLVRNAAEALVDKQDGPHHITLRVEATSRTVDIIVSDTGPGIPAHVQHQVFDPYVTTKTTGTGLGLAIVKKIVLEHGGTIAWNRLGQQTEFRVQLSLTDVQ